MGGKGNDGVGTGTETSGTNACNGSPDDEDFTVGRHGTDQRPGFEDEHGE